MTPTFARSRRLACCTERQQRHGVALCRRPQVQIQESGLFCRVHRRRGSSVPASAASAPASLWPPALMQDQARQQLFEMILVEGVQGDYNVAIDDVPAFVAAQRGLLETLQMQVRARARVCVRACPAAHSEHRITSKPFSTLPEKMKKEKNLKPGLRSRPWNALNVASVHVACPDLLKVFF
jgi:hypothetical protein